MIKYVKRNELDIEKYNACVENSLQSRVYGFSWYLDIVADHWDALVLVLLLIQSCFLTHFLNILNL